MKKKYACLDEDNVVIAIEELDIVNWEYYPNAVTYVEVDNGIREIPSIGQKWDCNSKFE